MSTIIKLHGGVKHPTVSNREADAQAFNASMHAVVLAACAAAVIHDDPAAARILLNIVRDHPAAIISVDKTEAGMIDHYIQDSTKAAEAIADAYDAC